jgi:hypothetical protein
VRIDGISRFAAPLCWALRPVPVVCIPEPPIVDAPAPLNYTPDYAVYLAERAEQREAERFTYADAIRARAIALAAAKAAARALEATPFPAEFQQAPAKAPQPIEPATTHQPAVIRPEVAAKRVEFSRVVETLDNRGSLIDILL